MSVVIDHKLHILGNFVLSYKKEGERTVYDIHDVPIQPQQLALLYSQSVADYCDSMTAYPIVPITGLYIV